MHFYWRARVVFTAISRDAVPRCFHCETLFFASSASIEHDPPQHVLGYTLHLCPLIHTRVHFFAWILSTFLLHFLLLCWKTAPNTTLPQLENPTQPPSKSPAPCTAHAHTLLPYVEFPTPHCWMHLHFFLWKSPDTSVRHSRCTRGRRLSYCSNCAPRNTGPWSFLFKYFFSLFLFWISMQRQAPSRSPWLHGVYVRVPKCIQVLRWTPVPVFLFFLFQLKPIYLRFCSCARTGKYYENRKVLQSIILDIIVKKLFQIASCDGEVVPSRIFRSTFLCVGSQQWTITADGKCDCAHFYLLLPRRVTHTSKKEGQVGSLETSEHPCQGCFDVSRLLVMVRTNPWNACTSVVGDSSN